jgi:hypothetical protein
MGTRKRVFELTNLQSIMSQPRHPLRSDTEGRVLLAIQAIQQGQFQSIRSAATLYDVPLETLRRRVHGNPARCDSTPNNRKLTSLEEEVLTTYILDLDS